MEQLQQRTGAGYLRGCEERHPKEGRDANELTTQRDDTHTEHPDGADMHLSLFAVV